MVAQQSSVTKAESLSFSNTQSQQRRESKTSLCNLCLFCAMAMHCSSFFFSSCSYLNRTKLFSSQSPSLHPSSSSHLPITFPNRTKLQNIRYLSLSVFIFLSLISLCLLHFCIINSQVRPPYFGCCF